MTEQPEKPQLPASEVSQVLPPTVSLDLPPALVQLADRFMVLQERQHKLHAEESVRQSEEVKMEMNIGYQLQREQMQNDRHQFNVVSALVTFIVLLLILLTAGIIFLKDDTKTGLLILSHAAALASGWLMRGASKEKKAKGQKADDNGGDDE